MLHRTLKIELDEGRASTIAEAEELVASHILQLVVGDGVAESATRQAMLATILNCAPRAFIGGVRVVVADDCELAIPWHDGARISEVARRYGADIVSEISESYPTIGVGEVAEPPVGTIVLHPTWNGWASGVVCSPERRLAEAQEMRLAGILAGALAVSEVFQHIRGSVTAGHRDIGISLWDLQANWRSEGAVGPRRYYLPDALWLSGLGHLGQANAWVGGLLAYPAGAARDFALQDTDSLVAANEATSLLATRGDLPDDETVGEKKTRLVARRLEEIGADTRLIERRFDADLVRQDGEPVAILAGFDDPESRQVLEGRGFDRIFDAGLGRGPRGYLDIVIHSFPSQRSAAEAFARRGVNREERLQPAYEALVDEMVEAGEGEESARCGVVEEIADRSVAASFVGATAACLLFAEILRDLRGAKRYSLIDLSLREPDALIAEPLQGTIEAASYGSILSAD
jgi:hypothetical protein